MLGFFFGFFLSYIKVFCGYSLEVPNISMENWRKLPQNRIIWLDNSGRICLFSSPEHEVLMVSFVINQCPSCGMRLQQLL